MAGPWVYSYWVYSEESEVDLYWALYSHWGSRSSGRAVACRAVVPRSRATDDAQAVARGLWCGPQGTAHARTLAF